MSVAHRSEVNKANLMSLVKFKRFSPGEIQIHGFMHVDDCSGQIKNNLSGTKRDDLIIVTHWNIL